GIVQPGHTQRHPGCHVDGFQGSRVDPKVMVNHTYVVCDRLPTVFCLQRWEVGQLDPTKHNFFLEFDRQAQEGNAWQADPFEIVLLNAYTVHKAATLPSSSPPLARTFLRLSYSVRVFDRLGNAHNPLFDYNWEMVPRDTQSTLSLWQQQEENAEEKREEREIKTT
ncbi:Phytanoyl-CoA dioxygenase, partial [Balamuthia mandrillaris]